MHRYLITTMVLTVLCGCCGKGKVSSGKSDSEWFDEIIALQCTRFDECLSDEEKASSPHMAGGDCETDLRRAMIEFNGGGLPSPCDGGESFHAEHAADCIALIRAASCDAIRTGSWDVDECAKMCR